VEKPCKGLIPLEEKRSVTLGSESSYFKDLQTIVDLVKLLLMRGSKDVLFNTRSASIRFVTSAEDVDTLLNGEGTTHCSIEGVPTCRIVLKKL
jgi:hypothetical protein